MKRTMLLAIGLIMVVSLVIYAVDQENVKTELIQTDECQEADGGIHAAANGFVIEISQKGTTYVTIVLKDAAPDYTYFVYSGATVTPDLIGTFTTNSKGNGGLYVSVAAPDLDINIWNCDKEISGAVLLLTGQCYCTCEPPCVPPCPCADPLTCRTPLPSL